MTKKSFSIIDRVKSFINAFHGLAHLFKNEHNSWIHATVMLIALVVGIIEKLNATEWIFIAIAIAIVFITEILNTAIERLTDLYSTNHHPLAKQAKDLGAAAVLLAAILAIAIGLIIFVPKIFG